MVFTWQAKGSRILGLLLVLPWIRYERSENLSKGLAQTEGRRSFCRSKGWKRRERYGYQREKTHEGRPSGLMWHPRAFPASCAKRSSLSLHKPSLTSLLSASLPRLRVWDLQESLLNATPRLNGSKRQGQSCKASCVSYGMNPNLSSLLFLCYLCHAALFLITDLPQWSPL